MVKDGSTSDGSLASTKGINGAGKVGSPIADVGELTTLLSGIEEHARGLIAVVDKLSEDVKTENERSEVQNTSRGLSYLDVKNILMLSYNCDLINLIKAKTEGR